MWIPGLSPIMRSMNNLMKLATILMLALTGPSSSAAAVSPPPVDAAGFTKMFASKNDTIYSGGDQSTSFKYNGRIYWLSGDTIISNGVDPDGSYADGATMVSNRILLQNGRSLTNAISGGGIAIPDPATRTPENQERYWPQGVFAAGVHLYVLAQRVTGGADFSLHGTELAKFSVADDGKLTFVGMVSTPGTGKAQVPGPAGIQWTGDAVVSGGVVYLYGFTLNANPSATWIMHHTYVARVPVGSIEDSSAWRFYKRTTGSWVGSVSELSQDALTQPDSIIPSQVTSARVINGKVVLAHKPWNGLGDKIFIEVGGTPVGPFTQTEVAVSAASTTAGGKSYITYAPQLHPEQKLTSGKLLLSINWNGKDFFADTLADADLYKPRFFEINQP